MGDAEPENPRSAVAPYCQERAARSDDDGGIVFQSGGRQAQLPPTEPVTFRPDGELALSMGDTEAKRTTEFESVRRPEARTPAEGTLDATPTGE